MIFTLTTTTGTEILILRLEWLKPAAYLSTGCSLLTQPANCRFYWTRSQQAGRLVNRPFEWKRARKRHLRKSFIRTQMIPGGMQRNLCGMATLFFQENRAGSITTPRRPLKRSCWRGRMKGTHHKNIAATAYTVPGLQLRTRKISTDAKLNCSSINGIVILSKTIRNRSDSDFFNKSENSSKSRTNPELTRSY